MALRVADRPDLADRIAIVPAPWPFVYLVGIPGVSEMPDTDPDCATFLKAMEIATRDDPCERVELIEPGNVVRSIETGEIFSVDA